jgi:integrase/recombinase XerD
VVGDGRLRVISGEVAPVVETRDPQRFQAECVEAFVASWTARGFAESTIANDVGVLERMLAALGRPVWEVTAADVDRVVGELASSGRAVSTRRNYVQVFKGFHRFLEVRRAAEIEAAFGVRLACPLDEFNAARHVGDDSPSVDAPPTPERVAAFFDFLKTRIVSSRKYAPAARDYALFRTLYHAGLRAEEVVTLDRADVHFGRGPFGKLHVRFGKGAKGSGPRPRWVPMLDGLDLVLRWYLDDVRGRFPDGPVLLCDESGGRMAAATIRNRLRHLMSVEGQPEVEWFSPHGMRRACATHNYERGVDLVAIQQLVGHWRVASTMRYVNPRELHQVRKEPPGHQVNMATEWHLKSLGVSCLTREGRRVIPSDARYARQQGWLRWLAEQQLAAAPLPLLAANAAAVRVSLPTTTCNRHRQHPPRDRPERVFGQF